MDTESDAPICMNAADVFWLLSALLLVATGCCLVGRHLVLQKKSTLGDALAHVSFPSLVLSVAVTGSLNPLSLLFSALLGALVTQGLIGHLKRKARLPEDLSIGVVFVTLFAFGVFVSSTYLRSAHIDVECLLFGELLYVPLEDRHFFAIPDSVAMLLLAVGVLLIVEWKFYRYFLALDFEPQAQVLSHKWFRGLHLFLVSWILVASFKIVGALLVLSFLVVPASLAKLTPSTHSRFVQRMLVSAIGLSAVGLGAALHWDINPAATTASILFVAFLGSSLLWRRREAYA
jgi:manganese/zinc/iron transport system permease protein